MVTGNYQAESDRISDGDDIYKLWNLLVQAAQSISTTGKDGLQKYELTPRYAQVLFIIHALKEKATLTTISHALFLEPSTISILLIHMRETGLIKKIRHPVNKSTYQIVLTDKGRKAFDTVVRFDSIHRIMQHLSNGERSQLQIGLNRILVQARQYLELNREGYLPWETNSYN